MKKKNYIVFEIVFQLTERKVIKWLSTGESRRWERPLLAILGYLCTYVSRSNTLPFLHH